MLQKTQVIILNSIKYADADLVVHGFTKDFGLKSYYLKGVLTAKKGKFKRSLFMPLNLLEIIAFHNTKGQLNTLKEAVLLSHYQELHIDIIKQSIILFISEILLQTLKDELHDEDLFDFINHSVQKLDAEEKVANFHLSFLGHYIKYLGFYPVINERFPYFDMVEGKYLEFPQSGIYLTGAELNQFTEVLKSDFEQIGNLKLTRVERNNILDRILQFMSLHLDAFKKPKSVVVLQELFH